ncbi:MAG: hypothetical protein J6V32_04570 [Elusimicrobiaceae bacterium]|nr:hypothetical protein [Elusimicrobiaceae bacterium]
MKKEISYKIVESAVSPLPKGFLARLPEIFAREGETIYKGRNEIKVLHTKDKNGRPLAICVKKYGIPPFFNRMFYSVGVRTPKARRTYENAQKIIDAGFQTPIQYGYVLCRKNGWIGESFSVGEFIENARTVGQDKKDAALVKAFAGYTAALHARGLMHLDYILNNILYTRKDDGYVFTLIDINRFSFRSSPVSGFWQAVNLMTPFHKPEELKPFVEAYEQAAHCPGKLVGRVLFFRRWRTRYSRLKKILKKIPGAKRVSKHRV